MRSRPVSASAGALALPRPWQLPWTPSLPSGGALLQRLAHGRFWIGALAFALIGIVTMQLLVLKLNTQIGRSLQQQVALQRSNAQLGIEDSADGAGGRVEPLASAYGMTLAQPGSLHFVNAGRADLSRAIAALSSSGPTQTTLGG